jgi:hypothetical protein
LLGVAKDMFPAAIDCLCFIQKLFISTE